MRAALSLLALMPLLALACGGGNDDSTSTSTSGQGGAGGVGGSGPGSGLPCDVEAVLQKNCRSCHDSSPKFGAPNPLVTHDDLHAAARSDSSKRIYELVGTRIHDDAKPMPPPPNARVSGDEAAILDAWVAAGAPASAESCGSGGAGGAGGEAPLGCTPDIELKPTSPYVMPQQVEDAYMCYGVTLQLDGRRHITTLAPLIDNSTIVHHMLLFAADAPYSTDPRPCSGATMGRLMGVWAPGGQALQLPAEAGFPVEGTAHFILQVHYSNLMGLSGEQDSSGYRLCSTTNLRPNDADIMAFGTTSINIPANGSQDLTCDLSIPNYIPELNIIAGMPHMHKLGRQIATSLFPGGSSPPVDLGSADPWDFDSQAWLDVSTKLKPGDLVRTRCAWNNPTPTNVQFGEDTSDEMCFGFVMYYPKIEFPQWNWGLPAFASSCSPTP
ncbi:peptidylglycine alpha-amidating monooxygenase [Chondromyces crocatus]|uniref:Peptidylglycine alpha-amidating monooxygenase n=1 Tax=Chondromyces crocatus TaxID=52 RepID=A0A0K1ESC4_CHOCO|nr:peptidylglycine alpha-amidating monooxygenase [Chondromyces crocatus]AKT43518.1 peptidylglycine alpha-amidating monooxygenase [Chondromyces crocatus]